MFFPRCRAHWDSIGPSTRSFDAVLRRGPSMRSFDAVLRCGPSTRPFDVALRRGPSMRSFDAALRCGPSTTSPSSRPLWRPSEATGGLSTPPPIGYRGPDTPRLTGGDGPVAPKPAHAVRTRAAPRSTAGRTARTRRSRCLSEHPILVGLGIGGRREPFALDGGDTADEPCPRTRRTPPRPPRSPPSRHRSPESLSGPR